MHHLCRILKHVDVMGGKLRGESKMSPQVVQIYENHLSKSRPNYKKHYVINIPYLSRPIFLEVVGMTPIISTFTDSVKHNVLTMCADSILKMGNIVDGVYLEFAIKYRHNSLARKLVRGKIDSQFVCYIFLQKNYKLIDLINLDDIFNCFHSKPVITLQMLENYTGYYYADFGTRLHNYQSISKFVKGIGKCLDGKCVMIDRNNAWCIGINQWDKYLTIDNKVFSFDRSSERKYNESVVWGPEEIE